MTSGDLATWVGAIATVGLFFGAVITALYAIKTFRAQDQQLKQDMEQRRRAQAASVYIEQVQEMNKDSSLYGTITKSTVHNTSRLPIYDLRVTWYKGTTQLEEYNQLKSLMPDTSHKFERGERTKELRAVVNFRDAAGIRWQRASDGTLQEVKSS
jgi:hypothetical protein